MPKGISATEKDSFGFAIQEVIIAKFIRYNTSVYDKALEHFKKVDPALYELAISIEPLTPMFPSSEHFTRLCRSIVGQQLSVKAAQTIFARFQNLFKNNITPEKLLKIDKEKLRECGISYPKIGYMKDLSEKVIEKKLILETIHNDDDETIIKNLTNVKGIGTWSAEMFLMFSLGRPDIFSVKDLGLKNAMIKLYGLEKPTGQELLKISEKWKPYRSFACMVLWRSLDNQP